VRHVNSLSVTDNGHLAYTFSGIDMTGTDLKNAASFASFLDEQKYTINGNSSANIISAGNNADKLLGLGGNDKLYGLFGNDRLDGGAGNDRLDGGAGNDRLDGGAGNDYLNGGNGKDVLIGGAGNDTYALGTGDTIFEAKGSAAGIDTVMSSISVHLAKFANVENVHLTGNAKLQAIGGNTAHTLIGNSGANVLAGGRGNDILTGGAGVDHFEFVKGDGTDTITDFHATGRNHDVIDFSGYAKLNFASLDIEKHGRHDVEITIGHRDHLILEHVNIRDLDLHDFHF
jgi:Ca2+-binding RTX toxin-like protein